MQDKGISFYHIHRALTLLNAISIVELDRPQVGTQENIRRDVTNSIGRCHFGVIDSASLGTDPHGQPQRLGCLRQIAINASGFIDATNHRGDHKGSKQPFA